MYDKIVLLDSTFPFGKGEEFLENEIKYCMDYCKELIIVPICASDFSKCRIQGNQNIKIVKQNYDRRKLKRYFKCINKCFLPCVRSEIQSCLKEKQGIRNAFKSVSYFEVGEYLTNEIAKELRSLLKKDDRVLFYAYWLDMCAFVAGRLKKLYLNAAAVSRAHGSDIYGDVQDPFLPYRKYIYDMLDKICPISENGKQYIQRGYPEQSLKIQTFYLGTEDHGLNRDSDSKQFHIVSCSGLLPVKRVELLIQALGMIHDIEIEWDHYGDGYLRKDLESDAENNFADNIKWKFHGHVTNRQLMEIYRKNHIDVFINVSESEGVPVSIMEALSFGIPVIATNVGGTGEIVLNHQNGILIEKNFSIMELADEIKRFANMREEVYASYKKNARIIWEEKLDARKNYRVFFENV